MDIKKYDKRLCMLKDLDGTKRVTRVSPYNASTKYEILKIQNQYVGSSRWIRNKLITMDTTRFDIVGKALRHNWNIRDQRDDNRISADVARFMTGGGDAIVL